MKKITLSLVLIILPSSLLSSCASVEEPLINAQNADSIISFSHDLENQRVIVNLKSTSQNDICVRHGLWPGSVGFLGTDNDSELPVLLVNKVPFRFGNIVDEYCPKNCAIRIRPEGSVDGIFKYTDFSIKKTISTADDLEFSFSISPYPC